MAKFYVVWQGRKRGIYNNWEECKQQIFGFENARYKSFPSLEEAKNAYYKGKADSTLQKSAKPIVPSLSVDAACSGNPGIMEYRGVDTETKEVIFASPRYPDATNNIGEFLALVQALAHLKKTGSDLPVYTDSVTALSWVRNKHAKTNLQATSLNAPVFDLIDRATAWLNSNSWSTKIMKWDTKNWGEIPADFGRK